MCSCLRSTLLSRQLIIVMALFGQSLNAQGSTAVEEVFLGDSAHFIEEHVGETFPFYGLAAYLNKVDYRVLNQQGQWSQVPASVALNDSRPLVVSGRFNLLYVQAPGLSLDRDGDTMTFDKLGIHSMSDVSVELIRKDAVSSRYPQLNQLRYANLWFPLAWLTRLMESTLVSIQAHLASNWGWALVLFAIFIRALMLPVAILIARSQRRASQIKTRLAPRIAEIKQKYEGEEAHHELMAAHKELGVTPFYTLKPMFAAMIQLPILIAVFNALAEMPQLDGQSFLWIENLAYPDSVWRLPMAIPALGNSLNLLPFVMTVATVLSVLILRNENASKVEMKSQKRNLYLMSAVFFVLFYPFPAAMVLYWTLANILSGLQQLVVRA
jgi:YidC/Oxa1 family membrane protein insertase